MQILLVEPHQIKRSRQLGRPRPLGIVTKITATAASLVMAACRAGSGATANDNGRCSDSRGSSNAGSVATEVSVDLVLEAYAEDEEEAASEAAS